MYTKSNIGPRPVCLLVQSPAPGYLLLGRNHSYYRGQVWLCSTTSGSPHSAWKCQNVQSGYFQQLKLLKLLLRPWSQCHFFCVSPSVKSPLAISLSLLTASSGVNTVLSNPWKKKTWGLLWFIQTGSFVSLVSAVSLKYISLEVNLLWATTSHPGTTLNNKSDVGSGMDTGA